MKAHCKPCDREVGIKIERPIGITLLGIIASIGSFYYLYSQIDPSWAVFGIVHQGSAPSNVAWLLPVVFLIFSLLIWTKMAVHKCPICETELE